MVQISIAGAVEPQGSKADVVKRLVVDTEGHVCVLHQLVDRQRCVVRLEDYFAHLHHEW